MARRRRGCEGPRIGSRRAGRWPAWLGIVLPGLLATGCQLSKTVYNEHVRELDASFIVSGETTWREVLRTLGPPAPWNPYEIGTRPSRRYFKYECAEETRSAFSPLPSVILPFEWTDRQPIHQIIVEFDDAGVVKDVFETRGDVLWRPFEFVENRPPTLTRRVGTREEPPPVETESASESEGGAAAGETEEKNP